METNILSCYRAVYVVYSSPRDFEVFSSLVFGQFIGTDWFDKLA